MKKDPRRSSEPAQVGNLYFFDTRIVNEDEHREETEGLVLLLLREDQLAEAELFIASCEVCSEFGEVTFDYLLDAVTECDPSSTEYLLPRLAKCPCGHEVSEKTLVSAL